MKRPLYVVLVFWAHSVAPAWAVQPQTQGPVATRPAQLAAQTPTEETGKERVTRPRYRYQGRNFGAWDYATTAVFGAAFLTVEFAVETTSTPHFTTKLPLDESVRNLVVADTKEQQDTANEISDYFWFSSMLYPFVAATTIPLARRSLANAPWQMTMMNLQAFSVSGLLVRLPEKLAGRPRPRAAHCIEDGGSSESCLKSTSLQSFPSGHTMMSMTGAGLSCAHHLKGELLASPVGDAVACTLALAAASTVGYLRMRADRHWHSDTIIGGLAGFAIGYLLPTTLYYDPFWKGKEQKSPSRRRAPARQEGEHAAFHWTLMPELGKERLGLHYLAVF